ncbi:sensor histidine kinase [Streptomyces sp. NPDC101152]|uniref:sensor histidine kinase n=1 Tax=Streptomyces sp. NPDC101152 TaxID=3366116 RepID=UPI00380CDAB3
MFRLIEGLSRRLRRNPRLLDLWVMALVGLPPVIREQDGWRPVWVQIVVNAALVLPLWWRRRAPVAVAVAVTAAFWVQYLGAVWGDEPGRGVLAVATVLYTLATLGLRRAAVRTAVCVAAGVVLWTPRWLASTDPAGAGPSPWLTPSTVAVWLAGAWVWGAYVRQRRAFLAESTRRVAAEERARIAREIHDVLAHGVSVMVLNAEGGRLARHTDPAAVDRALRTISATGREALTELRQLLGVLRDPATLDDRGPEGGPTPPPEPPAGARDSREKPDAAAEHTLMPPPPTRPPGLPPPAAPRAGLGDLRTLVDRFPGAAELDLRGDPREVPPGVAAQAYRIVQESLTNVAKHASPDATARVRVDVGTPGPGRRVRIRVDNSAGGTPAPAPTLPSAGRGLTGMRERAALYGGTVDAGRTDDGGYRVDATLWPVPR